MQSAQIGKQGGGFLAALGIARGAPGAEPERIDSRRPSSALASPAVSPRCTGVDSVPRVSRLIAMDAAGHAQELLAWLQGPGGRTGSISSADLAIAHGEMCDELEIEAIGWTAVSRELRRLLDQPRRYVDRSGRRVRMFRIPPAGVEALPRAAARWAHATHSEPLPRAA